MLYFRTELWNVDARSQRNWQILETNDGEPGKCLTMHTAILVCGKRIPIYIVTVGGNLSDSDRANRSVGTDEHLTAFGFDISSRSRTSSKNNSNLGNTYRITYVYY